MDRRDLSPDVRARGAWRWSSADGEWSCGDGDACAARFFAAHPERMQEEPAALDPARCRVLVGRGAHRRQCRNRVSAALGSDGFGWCALHSPAAAVTLAKRDAQRRATARRLRFSVEVERQIRALATTETTGRLRDMVGTLALLDEGER